MLKNIFGKKKSLQRNLIKEIVIVFVVLVLLSVSIFYLSVNRVVEKQLKNIEIKGDISASEIVGVVRRSVIISVGTTIAFVIVIMKYSASKILNPIKQINEATKKIATGDFDIELESEREDEIGELTHNFNVMAKDLNKIEVLQKDFINNVSHEIKTPISSIKGFAQLLEQENVTEDEKKEYISIIVEESDRLLNISSNILKLSKLQTQDKLKNKKEVLISEQIKKVINVLESKIREKNITVIANLPKTIIQGDEELLYQVWMNLIENAIKFTKNDGNINIDIEKSSGMVKISIKDDGIGMTKEEMKKVFERFYQVDESHYSQGSGLGLAIVRRIVTLSGGNINVESEKEKGSTFIVELPYEKNKNKSKIKIK